MRVAAKRAAFVVTALPVSSVLWRLGSFSQERKGKIAQLLQMLDRLCMHD